ncbi:hypothetical protein [Parashewanella tropica]|uniref:hypothetical protein n=1 Tax=Parashewanella tropica TaxID=2547970 RepID=UPI001059F01C|nr:hypothetical protein [Parashewanella tropica]
MKKLTIGTILFASAFSIQASPIPNSLAAGFKAYSSDGPRSAIQSWVKGGAMENNLDALSQANRFRQIEDYYGKYQGFEIVKSNKISSKSSVYLVTINYKKGILYSKFFTYRNNKNKEIVTSFKFHTEAEMVWPKYLIYGQ